MFSLLGKVAWITGASGGLGSGIAKSLHACGAHVVLLGRKEDALKALCQDLGERCSYIVGDVQDFASLKPRLDQAVGSYGLDILVNNAGITRDGLMMRMTLQDWESVLSVNLTSCFHFSQYAIKHMVKKRWGRIINISSTVGSTGNAGQTNYAASKAGLEGMSKSLAQEVAARQITVNCVAPGFMDAGMTDALSPDKMQQYIAHVPLKRAGTAEDVGASVVFLASEEAGYVTGHTLHVNGGMAMSS